MKQIKIPKINEDLAYLCGVLAGDGCISLRPNKNEYSIHCGGNFANEVEFYDQVIVPLFKKLFDLDVEAKYLGKNSYGVKFCSKSLFKFLINSVGLTPSPKNNLMVPKVFYSDDKLLFSFIRGVFDTDFCLDLKGGSYPVITGVSKSREFLDEISKILEKFNFKVCRQFDLHYKDVRFKSGYFIINRIHICGHRMFLKWLDLIGTRQPKNLKKIDLWEKRNENGKQSWKWVDLYRYEKSPVYIQIKPLHIESTS